MQTRRLSLLAAAVVTASAAVPVVAVSASPGPRPAPPLRVLLTNDDGYDAPGLVAVRDALRAAGNEVTVVAPLTNQSGTSARLTFGGSVQVTQPSPGTYAVAGSPADAVEVGLSTVFRDRAPDLVVSGSNAGQNIAAATIHSGTIGAAVTALEDGVPAIAVSTEQVAAPPYAESGAFVARLVAALRAEAGRGPLLPEGTGLNVNVPFVEDGSTATPVLTRTGRGFLDVGYTGALPAVGGQSSLAVTVDQGVPETVRDSDNAALRANRIAVTVIEGDYDAGSTRVGERAERDVARVLERLSRR